MAYLPLFWKGNFFTLLSTSSSLAFSFFHPKAIYVVRKKISESLKETNISCDIQTFYCSDGWEFHRQHFCAISIETRK